jgi:hypothetical protein
MNMYWIIPPCISYHIHDIDISPFFYQVISASELKHGLFIEAILQQHCTWYATECSDIIFHL